jgi:hypothetical protein
LIVGWTTWILSAFESSLLPLTMSRTLCGYFPEAKKAVA